MSHFTVLVIGENYIEQLAPYDEEIQVEAYKTYEEDPQWLFDAWKRRDEPPEAPRSMEEMFDGPPPLPPTDVSMIPNPSLEELITWIHEEWGEKQYGFDADGLYRMTTYNPKSKWDWYEVGGRWSGYFKLKEEVKDRGETLAVIGRPGVFNNPPENDADICRKGDVDAEGMRDEAGERAAHRWDLAHQILDGIEQPLSWKQVCAKHTDSNNVTDYEAAREEYHAQEGIRVIKEHDQEAMKDDRNEDILAGFMGRVDDFFVTRESFIQDARDACLPTYAYLKDGEWVAPGEMGWWGVSTDGDLDKRRYRQHFNEMWDQLHDDTVLTLVDCHI